MVKPVPLPMNDEKRNWRKAILFRTIQTLFTIRTLIIPISSNGMSTVSNITLHPCTSHIWIPPHTNTQANKWSHQSKQVARIKLLVIMLLLIWLHISSSINFPLKSNKKLKRKAHILYEWTLIHVILHFHCTLLSNIFDFFIDILMHTLGKMIFFNKKVNLIHKSS